MADKTIVPKYLHLAPSFSILSIYLLMYRCLENLAWLLEIVNFFTIPVHIDIYVYIT